MKQQHICGTCGLVGLPKKQTKGSFVMELFLWLFFILPGVIYSLWRVTTRYKGCRFCGSTDIVQLNTPRGHILQSQYGPLIDQQKTWVTTAARLWQKATYKTGKQGAA
jgi:hypothetical protein